MGPVEAAMEIMPVIHFGVDPDGKPAVHHSTAARAAVPTPSVMMSGCTRKRRDRKPLSAPIDAVRPTTSTTTNGSVMPAPKASAATMLATPTRNGIDRSMPPITMTRLWPTEAMPTKEASTRMARTLRSLAKPSISTAPATKSSDAQQHRQQDGRSGGGRGRPVVGFIVACHDGVEEHRGHQHEAEDHLHHERGHAGAGQRELEQEDDQGADAAPRSRRDRRRG